MTALVEDLGFTIQDAKTIWPTLALEFLGLELDTDAMEARMPPDKIAWLGDLLADWRQRRTCRLRDLQALIGFLQFAAQVIPHARAFIRRLIKFSATFSSDFASRHTPQYARGHTVVVRLPLVVEQRSPHRPLTAYCSRIH